MSDPMVSYTLSALQIAMLNPVFNPPKGLFDTKHKVGQLFAIIVGDDCKYSLLNIPVTNDEAGELQACEVMDQLNFVGWAIDPWTSEISLEIEE
jgi:hypothetical protein